MAAVDTTASAIGTSEVLGETPVGTIAQTLPFLSQISTGEVLTIGQIAQSFNRSAYITTGKAVQGEWPNYESYDKPEFWSTTSTKLTFASFLRYGDFANTYSWLFGNGPIGLQGANWYDGGNNAFDIWIYDSSFSGVWNDTLGLADHGIEVGDWFTLMFSIDYSGVTPIFNVWTHKKGDDFAVNIFGVNDDEDTGPRNISTDDSAGSNAAIASHPWYTSQSTNIEISELFLTDEFVDWGDAAVRAKYVDPETGRPVGLGADGSALTGTAAKIYLPDGDGTDNKGTAGNFTEVGTIDDSSTSPSDGAVAGPWFSQSLTGVAGQSVSFGVTTQTLGAISQSVKGYAGNNLGIATQTLPSISQAATGTFVRGFAGTMAQTLPFIVQTGSAISWEGIDTGTIAQPLPFLTVSITAMYWPSWRWGEAEQNLSFLTQTAVAYSGPGIQTGEIAQTINGISQSLNGRNPGIYPGRIAQTLPFVTQVVTATYGPGIKIGIIDSTLSMLIQTGTAHYEPGTVTGYANLFLWPIAQALVGVIAHAGVIDQVLPGVSQTGTATYDSGTYTASGAQSVAFLTQTLTGKMERTGIIHCGLVPVTQSLTGKTPSTGAVDQTLSFLTQSLTATYSDSIHTGTIYQTLPFISQEARDIKYVVIPAPPLVWEQPDEELIWEQQLDELVWES